MLSKLLKNEFIATGRIMGALYAVVAIISAYVLGSYYFTKDTASTGQILGVTVLLLITASSFLLTTVVMIVNFQKTLYGDQGYLSFTLPVKGSSLLTSKVLVSTLWYIIAFACFMGSAALTAFIVKEDVIGDESYDMIQSLLPMFMGGRSITTIVWVVVLSVIGYFVRFAVITVELYFAISLANTRHFQRKTVLWIIIFSLATIGIVESISGQIANRIDFGIGVSGNQLSIVTDLSTLTSGMSFINLMSIIIPLVFGVIFYFLTYYVMNKKVNIK